MIEDVTTALQAFASTGNGFTLTLRDARFLTFKVQGNGNVTAGAVTLECCPQNTPIAPGSGSAGAKIGGPEIATTRCYRWSKTRSRHALKRDG